MILHNISWSFNISYSYNIIMYENVLKVGGFLSRNENIQWLSVDLNSSPLASILDIYVHISSLLRMEKKGAASTFCNLIFGDIVFFL